MDITREQFDQELAGIKDQLAAMGITEEQARRKYFRRAIAPTIKGRSMPERQTALQEWGMVAPAPNVRPAANVLDAFTGGMNEQAAEGMTGKAIQAGVKATKGEQASQQFGQTWRNLTTGGETVYPSSSAQAVADAAGRFVYDTFDPLGALIFRGAGAAVEKVPGAQSIIQKGGNAALQALGKVSRKMHVQSPQIAQGAVRDLLAGVPASGAQALTYGVSQGYVDGNLDAGQLTNQTLAGLGMGVLSAGHQLAKIPGNAKPGRVQVRPSVDPMAEEVIPQGQPAPAAPIASAAAHRVSQLPIERLAVLRNELLRKVEKDPSIAPKLALVEEELAKRQGVNPTNVYDLLKQDFAAQAVAAEPAPQGMTAMREPQVKPWDVGALPRVKTGVMDPANLPRVERPQPPEPLAAEQPGALVDDNGHFIQAKPPQTYPKTGMLGAASDAPAPNAAEILAIKQRQGNPAIPIDAGDPMEALRLQVKSGRPGDPYDVMRQAYREQDAGGELNFLWDLAAETNNQPAMSLVQQAAEAHARGDTRAAQFYLQEAQKAVNPSKGAVAEAAPEQFPVLNTKPSKANLKVENMAEHYYNKRMEEEAAAAEAMHGELLQEAQQGYEQAIANRDLEAATRFTRAASELGEASNIGTLTQIRDRMRGLLSDERGEFSHSQALAEVAAGIKRAKGEIRDFFEKHVRDVPRGAIVENPTFYLGHVSQDAIAKAARFVSDFKQNGGGLLISGRSIKHIAEDHPNEIDPIITYLSNHPVEPTEVLPNPTNPKRVWFIYGKEGGGDYINVVEAEPTGGTLHVASAFTANPRRLKKARELKSELEGRQDPHPIDPEGSHAVSIPDGQLTQEPNVTHGEADFKTQNREGEQGFADFGVLTQLPGAALQQAAEQGKQANVRLNQATEQLLGLMGLKVKDGNLVIGSQFKERAQHWINRAMTGNKAADDLLTFLRQWFTANGGRGEDWVKMRELFDQTRMQDNAQTNRLLEEIGSLSKEDRVRLHDEYTGDAPRSGDFDPLIEKIRQQADPLGSEKERLGFISENSLKTHGAGYLQREYLIHEQGPFSRAAASFARLAEGQLKQRGNVKWLSPEVWQQIEARKGEGPWKVVSEGDGHSIIQNERGQQLKVGKERADLILNDYQLRYDKPNKDGQVGVWRDWTNQERSGWGQIRDAEHVVGKTLRDSYQLVRSGQLFEQIAKNPEMAVSREAYAANPARYEGWKFVPFKPIRGAAPGAVRWGALSDHWVRPDVHTDLMMVRRFDNHPALKAWDAGQNFLRKIQVVYNPAAIGGELIGNTAFYQVDHPGGNVAYVADGFNHMRQGEKSPWFKEAERAGLFEGDYTTGDAQAMLRKLPQISGKSVASVVRGLGQFMKLANESPKRAGAQALDATAKAASLPFKVTEHFYRKYANDAFRLAHYIDFRENRGMSPEEAVQATAEAIYSRPPAIPALQAVRRFWQPYIGFWAWRSGKLAEAMVERPHEVAKLWAILAAARMLGKAFGTQDDSDEEGFRDDQKGRILMPGLGPKAMLPLPGADASGNPRYLDLSRAMPSSQMFALSDKYPVPIPKALEDGGLVSIVGDLRGNQERFTGKDIIDRNAPLEVQAGQLAQYLGRTLTPNHPLSPLALLGLPSYSQQKLGKAIKGERDAFGRGISVPEAALSSLGVKVNTVDPVANTDAQVSRISRKIGDAERGLRNAQRDLDDGKIDQVRFRVIKAAYERQIQGYESQLDRIYQALTKRKAK